MKKRTLSFIIPAISFFLILYCSHEQSDYRQTLSAGTIEACETFLQKYPDGRYSTAIQDMRDSLQYHVLLRSDDREAWRRFIEQQPYSRYYPAAWDRYDSLCVEHLLTLDQIDTLRNYLEVYPASRFRGRIKAKLRSLYNKIEVTIDIGSVWHNFYNRKEIRQQILGRLDSMANDAGFTVVEPGKGDAGKAWGRLSCRYSETNPFDYLHGKPLQATRCRLEMRLTHRENVKTTWQNVQAEFQNPSSFFTFNNEAVSSEGLRETSFKSLWGKIPGLLIVPGHPPSAAAQVQEVPPQSLARYLSSGPVPSGKIDWELNNITQPMLAAAGDTLFFFMNDDLTAYSVTRQKIVWKYRLGNQYQYKMRKMLEIIDRTVLFSTSETIFAVDSRNGSELWRCPTEDAEVTGIHKTAYGYLVSGNTAVGGGGFLCMLEPTQGMVKWRQTVSRKSLEAIPAMDTEYVYYFAEDTTSRAYFHQVSLASGEIVKRTRDDNMRSNPRHPTVQIGDDLIGDFYGIRRFTRPYFKQKWEFNTGHDIISNFILWQNHLYFAGYNGFLYSLSPENGRPEWKLKYRDGPASGGSCQFTISLVDGILYLPSPNGYLYWVDPVSGKCLWFKKLGDWIECQGPLIRKGKIYIIVDDGILYCLS